MKAIKLVLALLVFALSSSAQFTVRENASAVPVLKSYDSTVNFVNLKCGYAPESLIGQEICFIPGFSNGYNPANIDAAIRNLVTDPSGNGQKGFRFYKIVSFKSSPVEGTPYCWCDVTLQDDKNGKINWRFHSNTDNYFVVYIKGYVEKLKSSYLNKPLYYEVADWSSNTIYNELKQENAPIAPGQRFIVSDLTFVPTGSSKNLALSLILKDDKNAEYAIFPASPYNDYKGKLIHSFWTEEQYLAFREKEKKDKDVSAAKEKEELARMEKDRRTYEAYCIKTYGKEMGTLIAAGKVRIGMTKAMCEDAWGTPEHTSRTAMGKDIVETWIYNNGRAVSFVNNRVKQIVNETRVN